MPRRERPIAPETGETVRAAGLVIVGVFLSAVFLVPLSQFAWELAKGEKFQEFDIFRRVPTLKNIKRYEDDLSDASAVAEALRPETQWAQLVLVNQGNEKVVVGLDGWLFYRTDIRYSTGPAFGTAWAIAGADAERRARLPGSVDFHRQVNVRH